jgi:beta-glucosidase
MSFAVEPCRVTIGIGGCSQELVKAELIITREGSGNAILN